MQRINVQYFYQLASNLLPLKTLTAGNSILNEFTTLWDAEREIKSFLGNTVIPPTTSYAAGKELSDALEALTSNLWRTEPDNGNLQAYEVSNITSHLSRFEVVLQAEFSRRDTFTVSRKALYSTTDLIEAGEFMVSQSARDKMPEMVPDLHDAGRCVAFELATAAAFHLYRAAEAATKAYILAVRGTPVTAEEKKHGMGGYANLLKKRSLGVDERIYTSLAQLTRLHRNPSIHPDQRISNAEVIGTMGMVVSVIEVMVLDMDRRQNTPQIPLSQILPDDSLQEAAALAEVQAPPTLPPVRRRRRLNKPTS